MNFPFQFIFLGNTHGYLDDFKKQKELIEEFNPEFVLSEDMQNMRLDSESKYNKILESKEISDMVSFSEVKNLITFCKERKIKLIGIDLYNYGFNESLKNKIKNQEKLSKEEEEEINRILELREKHQIEMIQEFENASKKPILIIIGTWHLREGSPVTKANKRCKIIFPCDKNKNIVLGPPNEKSDMQYCEK
jgi:uncharacterized iron-regulated protein